MEENLKNKIVASLMGQQKRIENSDNPIDFDRAKTMVMIANAIVNVHQIDSDIDKTVPVVSSVGKAEFVPATESAAVETKATFTTTKTASTKVTPAPLKTGEIVKISVPEGEKFCKKCSTSKHIDLFYNKKTSKDGKMDCCKECHNDMVKASNAKKESNNPKPKREKKEKPESGKFIGRAKLNAIFKAKGWPEPKEFALPQNQQELDDLITSVQSAREIAEGMTVKTEKVEQPKAEPKPVRHEGPKRMEKNRVGDKVKYIHLTGDQRTGIIQAFTDANKVTPKGDYYSFDTAAIKDDNTGTVFDRPLHKIKKIEE